MPISLSAKPTLSRGSPLPALGGVGACQQRDPDEASRERLGAQAPEDLTAHSVLVGSLRPRPPAALRIPVDALTLVTVQ